MSNESIPQEIALIEELAANAVPPAVAQELDGWRLRFNFGFTRRANSVLAAGCGTRLDREQRMAIVEEFYRRRDLPARFQICPASQPADLDRYLEQRGYLVDPAITSVQTAEIGALLRHSDGAGQIDTHPDAAWLAAYWAGEEISDPHKQAAQATMLSRIGPPAGFAARRIDGQIAALALGVVERGWLGVFSVATMPAFRRRGLATQALADLAHWAQDQGATRCYLQVMHANSAALPLYRRLGFVAQYDYWYRVQA